VIHAPYRHLKTGHPGSLLSRDLFRVQLPALAHAVEQTVIYGPTRFASDFEALINKFIAFIYPACEPGVLYSRSPNAIR
jgi:hypothetical protein